MRIIKPGQMRGGVVPAPKFVTLVSCSNQGKGNMLAVSYQGQLSNGVVYAAIRPKRYSNCVIRESKHFGINYMEAEWVKEVDFCGIVSGRDYDKFLITGLTRDKAVNSASPLIMEAGISLDCILKDIWKVGGHDVFIGKVLKIIDRTNKAQGFQDWLYHNKFTYYGREGRLGELYKVGRELIPK